MRFLDDGTVAMTDGKPLRLEARSMLVHSDTPGAANHPRAIRIAVEGAGGHIVPLATMFDDAGA